jgi:uncharacterized membrane protein YjdF
VSSSHLLRRHPVIAAASVGSTIGWAVFGFASGSSSTPFYVGWMVIAYVVTLVLDRRYPFSRTVLAGLATWGFMHMAGGMMPVGDGILYQQWLLPFLRYDQLTHAIGFGFAGLAVREQFTPWLPHPRVSAVFTVVFLGGVAIGAINELLEFLLTRVVPDTNVGGFENTGWDLAANTVGSAVAALWAARQVSKAAGPAQPSVVS